MNRQEIIARLRENEAELRARGVVHAALFGSRARRYVGLKDYIASLFDGHVDVVNRAAHGLAEVCSSLTRMLGQLHC